MSSVFNPILRLYCLDASVAMEHVFKNYKNVIITSGTLSPIEIYPKILNFVPGHIYEIGATLERNFICPMIITKGNDQMLIKNDLYPEGMFDNSHNPPITDHLVFENDCYTGKNPSDKITTSFSLRNDPSVVRNYGNLLISLSKVVPDNIVCFFPSYIYMEEMITLWSESGIIREILGGKLIFIETPDSRETALALENFKKSCDTGRGAILLSVARGKVSEGIDFEHGYARAVVVLGIPYMYTESIRLKERLKFLKAEYDIKEYDFLVFDAMRHAAQCLGRVLRNKTDYGLMIMADSRFSQANIFGKMPRWIRDRIERGNIGLSIDMAMNIGRAFFREMGQPLEGLGDSLIRAEGVDDYLKKTN